MGSVGTDMIKWTMGGTISTSQTWSFGVWSAVATVGTPTSSTLDTALGVVASSFDSFWNVIKTKNAAAVVYNQLRAYYYPSGSTSATLISQLARTASAGTGGGNQSPRTCLVVTLLTGAAGRTRKGRIYIPYTADTVGTNLQAPTTTCDALANGANSLSTALNSASLGSVWGNAPWNVRSEKTGTTHPVLQFRCDSLIDSQRRREDKILPAYTKIAP